LSLNVTLIVRCFIWERLFIARPCVIRAVCLCFNVVLHPEHTETTCIALLVKVRIQIEKVAPMMRYSQIAHDRKNRVLPLLIKLLLSTTRILLSIYEFVLDGDWKGINFDESRHRNCFPVLVSRPRKNSPLAMFPLVRKVKRWHFVRTKSIRVKSILSSSI